MAYIARVLLATIAVHLAICASAIDSCYTTDQHPYRYYASKTRYNSGPFPTSSGSQIACQRLPTFLYAMVRHGIRYPSEKIIRIMNTKIPALRDAIDSASATMCQADIDGIKAWTPTFKPSDDYEMSETGMREMYEIGAQFQGMFPELLKATYDGSVNIRPTYKRRAIYSAKPFVQAIYNTTDVPMEIHSKGDDYVMRFHDTCNKYINTVGDVPVAEFEEFIEGPLISNMIASVTRRLGLQPGLIRTYGDLQLLWDMCRYEYNILSKSPWCAAFTTSELRVLEYSADLKDYWRRGPGSAITGDMTCELIKDLVTKLRSAEHGKGLKAALRFGHSDTVQPFFNKLGLLQDESPLLADNMGSMGNRKLRASTIYRLGSSLGFALYNCTDGPYVRVLLNEEPVQMPGCSNSDMCSLSTLLDDSGLQAFADVCNYDEICENILSKATSQRVLLNFIWIGLSVIITMIF